MPRRQPFRQNMLLITWRFPRVKLEILSNVRMPFAVLLIDIDSTDGTSSLGFRSEAFQCRTAAVLAKPRRIAFKRKFDILLASLDATAPLL